MSLYLIQSAKSQPLPIRAVLKKIPLFELGALLIAFFAITDWCLHTGIFHLLGSDFTMGPVTAITFVFAGASKFIFEYASSNKKLLHPARVLAVCTMVMGIIGILAVATGFTSIENIFFTVKITVADNGYTSVMRLIVALGFVFTGNALYRITFNYANKIFIPHILAITTLLVALITSIIYVFNRNTFYGISFYKPMGLLTAINFILITFSILLVNKRKGFISDLLGEYQGSKIARVMLPMAIGIPLILGFFTFKGGQAAFAHDPLGIALLTTGRIIILILFIWRMAVIINRSNKSLVEEIEERKRTEIKLRYRTALLEAQNEAIPDAILIVDTKGAILSYNAKFGKLWRIPEKIIYERDDDAALKFAMTQLVDPAGFIERVNYLYANTKERAHDEILFTDGRIIERYGNEVVGDDGTKYGWAWYFRDITQSKNYESKIKSFNKDLEIKVKERTEELYKSEKRFRSLVENAQDIISLSDENGMRFYMSPGIQKITGYTAEEMINQKVYELMHPDDVSQSKDKWKEYSNQPGVIHPMSFRFLHKNGGYVWMEGTIVNLLHDENVKAVVGNYHDVTQRKISEEKIRLSNERFEMVSRATNDAVWDWDLSNDKIYWNDEIKSMFGCCSDDVASGSRWKVHIHPEDFKRVIKKFVHHIKKGIQNWQDEYRFQCTDGTYKYVFTRGFILFDNNNKPYRIIGAMQDVTTLTQLQQSLNNERMRRQKELTDATIQGQEKERTEIGRELHDNINQLLTATKLYLSIAATQSEMKDEMIQRSAENLSFCVEEIRKLSSALVPPSIGVNSLSEIVHDLIESIKLFANINIDYEVNYVNKKILTNEQQLHIYRIIQEHMNNILKHANAKNVFISLKYVGHQIDIKIKDDGQGFDTTIKRHGIGFKNIQSRAELLDGKMKLVSSPGKGCMLDINFPLQSLN